MNAQELGLERIAAKICGSQKAFMASGANAVGDDIELYAEETELKGSPRFIFLRQQMQKPTGQFNHCLADLT